MRKFPMSNANITGVILFVASVIPGLWLLGLLLIAFWPWDVRDQ